MPNFILVTATWEHESGLPADRAVNTFHFLAQNDPPTTDYADCVAAVVNFYEVAGAAGRAALQTHLSPNLTGVYTLKAYDLSDPMPRVPRDTVERTADVNQSLDALPEEVALCGSYKAAAVSGANARRQRGRIYLGPLNTAVQGALGRPTAAVIADLNASMKALRDDAATNWAVYSRVDDAMALIDNGYTDNMFDTQRRRGPKPTARTLWP